MKMLQFAKQILVTPTAHFEWYMGFGGRRNFRKVDSNLKYNHLFKSNGLVSLTLVLVYIILQCLDENSLITVIYPQINSHCMWHTDLLKIQYHE